MRYRLAALLVMLIGLAVPAGASAQCVHVVVPGESLTSVAAADGLTVGQHAAANGLSAADQLVAGSCLTIPAQGGGTVSSAAAPAPTTASGDGDADGDDGGMTASVATPTSGGSYVVQPGDTLTAIAARAGMTVSELAAANGINATGPLLSGTALRLSGSATPVSSGASTSMAAPASGGSYVVQPGDTLTAIAARAGTSVSGLAAANGLNPIAPLLIGTVLRLSGSGSLPQSNPASASAAASQPVGTAAEGSSSNPPYPTSERLSATEIGQIASSEGVPPAFAEAIAWQESGFNNDLVSSADARGIMQILPGTWSWIGQDLATPPPLGQASAAQNVRAGTLMLHSLLQATGGNEQLAAAGYFQGLPSVQQNGMYASTQQYVNDVMSLVRQFGGG